MDCQLCNGTHEAELTFHGVPVIACPEYPAEYGQFMLINLDYVRTTNGDPRR